MALHDSQVRPVRRCNPERLHVPRPAALHLAEHRVCRREVASPARREQHAVEDALVRPDTVETHLAQAALRPRQVPPCRVRRYQRAIRPRRRLQSAASFPDAVDAVQGVLVSIHAVHPLLCLLQQAPAAQPGDDAVVRPLVRDVPGSLHAGQRVQGAPHVAGLRPRLEQSDVRLDCEGMGTACSLLRLCHQPFAIRRLPRRAARPYHQVPQQLVRLPAVLRLPQHRLCSLPLVAHGENPAQGSPRAHGGHVPGVLQLPHQLLRVVRPLAAPAVLYELVCLHHVPAVSLRAELARGHGAAVCAPSTRAWLAHA
mmetsp:Transcript_1523/g.5195  ORF Transcript_1523/g.5195 Transcript_1523/m.5195 type:complete len:312 (+) Transcript_1523:1198-2133(+)